MPKTVAVAADSRLVSGRHGVGSSKGGGGSGTDTRCQNSRSRATRCAGGLPAMSAALIAPMDTPATQSGAAPAAAKPS